MNNHIKESDTLPTWPQQESSSEVHSLTSGSSEPFGLGDKQDKTLEHKSAPIPASSSLANIVSEGEESVPLSGDTNIIDFMSISPEQGDQEQSEKKHDVENENKNGIEKECQLKEQNEIETKHEVEKDVDVEDDIGAAKDIESQKAIEANSNYWAEHECESDKQPNHEGTGNMISHVAARTGRVDVAIPWDGSPISFTTGKPIIRLFEPALSHRHYSVPESHLVTYDPVRQICQLVGRNPSTGKLEVDGHTLVLMIDGMLGPGYGGVDARVEPQAGFTVWFGPGSRHNFSRLLSSGLPQTHQAALLGAVYAALRVVEWVITRDPTIWEVAIVCNHPDICRGLGVFMEKLEHGEIDRDRVPLKHVELAQIVHELWKDVSKGKDRGYLNIRLMHDPSKNIL